MVLSAHSCLMGKQPPFVSKGSLRKWEYIFNTQKNVAGIFQRQYLTLKGTTSVTMAWLNHWSFFGLWLCFDLFVVIFILNNFLKPCRMKSKEQRDKKNPTKIRKNPPYTWIIKERRKNRDTSQYGNQMGVSDLECDCIILSRKGKQIKPECCSFAQTHTHTIHISCGAIIRGEVSGDRKHGSTSVVKPRVCVCVHLCLWIGMRKKCTSKISLYFISQSRVFRLLQLFSRTRSTSVSLLSELYSFMVLDTC